MEGVFLLENIEVQSMDIRALAMANTHFARVNDKDLSDKCDEFYDAQSELNEPMVIICDLNNTRVLEHFHVVARDMEDFNTMFKLKIFYTSDLPKGESVRKYGALFYGVDPVTYLAPDEEDEEIEESELVM
jgi:hypothetical protein